MRRRTSEQEDYLLRIIKQVSEAIARVRELLTAKATPSVTVREEVRQATALLLGAESPLLTRLDPESAARLVGSPQRIELWATLLELDAEAADVNGEPEQASAIRDRAAALRTASSRLPA